MFSYVPSDVLQKNPGFHALYKDLINNKLNLDGSTRSGSTLDKQIDAELYKAQKEAAESAILKSQLLQLSSRSRDLPSELREVVDISVESYKPGVKPLSSLVTTLRSEDKELFINSIPEFSGALSSNLVEDALRIAAIVNIDDPSAATTSQSERTTISNLPTQIANKQSSIANKAISLTTTRLSVISTLDELLKTYNSCIEQCIKILEQSKLGIVSRASRAQARHLALVAEGFEGKLKVLQFEALEQIYTAGTIEALENYKAHLNEARIKLLQRERAAEEELERYEQVGKDMKGLVAKYSQMTREVEMVTADIKRLSGEV